MLRSASLCVRTCYAVGYEPAVKSWATCCVGEDIWRSVLYEMHFLKDSLKIMYELVAFRVGKTMKYFFKWDTRKSCHDEPFNSIGVFETVDV
jgi:hypothetical protein